jgi:CHAD domain-containing protein
MTQQNILHILKSRFEKIQATFDVAITYFDAEDVHNFRVEVKKLRAFLHLVPSGVNVKLPPNLHHFYRMVGGIRNLQLQEQRIHDAFIRQDALPQTYLNLLAIETAAAIRRAKKFAANKLSIPLEERQLLSTFTHHIKGNSQEFARNIVSRLQTLSDNRHPIDDEDLHSLRKYLKDILYNHHHIENEAIHILPSILSDGKESVVALIGLLGQIQDLRSGLLLLQPGYIDQITDDGERKMLEEIRSIWRKDKSAIKDQVLASLQPILSPPADALYVLGGGETLIRK